jgi:hypothetical protein
VPMVQLFSPAVWIAGPPIIVFCGKETLSILSFAFRLRRCCSFHAGREATSSPSTVTALLPPSVSNSFDHRFSEVKRPFVCLPSFFPDWRLL